MAKTINIAKNVASLPVANGGLKLSKTILISEIEEHEKFKILFKIDEFLKERISVSMKDYGFDASQPVHIWMHQGHKYLIDGYTRIAAAIGAGLKTVPYFEHNFENFDEAYRYVLSLQVNRRNLSGQDLLINLEQLMGSDYIQNLPGNKNAAIGDILGVSEKTVERAKFVNENADEEQKARIDSGESTVNEIFNEIKNDELIENEADEEQKARIDSGEASKKEIAKEIKSKKTDRHVSVEDDVDESLGSNEGVPSGLNFNHSDGIERPSYKISAEEDLERTCERRASYESGYVDGFIKAVNILNELIQYGEKIEDVVEQIMKATDFETLSNFQFDFKRKNELDDTFEDIDININ